MDPPKPQIRISIYCPGYLTMKITILAVGTKMPRWVNDAYNDYSKRFGRSITIKLEEIKPEKRRSINVNQGINAEHNRLLSAIPSQSRLVVLDERGRSWTSVQLTEGLKGWMDNHNDVAFIIGGADGLRPELKQRADVLLQLSAMTLPHCMARVILIEQLYRAYAMLEKHPYHRA